MRLPADLGTPSQAELEAIAANAARQSREIAAWKAAQKAETQRLVADLQRSGVLDTPEQARAEMDRIIAWHQAETRREQAAKAADRAERDRRKREQDFDLFERARGR